MLGVRLISFRRCKSRLAAEGSEVNYQYRYSRYLNIFFCHDSSDFTLAHPLTMVQGADTFFNIGDDGLRKSAQRSIRTSDADYANWTKRFQIRVYHCRLTRKHSQRKVQNLKNFDAVL